MKFKFLALSAFLALWVSPAGQAQSSSSLQLRVGAAKVDITIEPGEASAAAGGRGGRGAPGAPGGPAAPGGQASPGAGRAGGPAAPAQPQPVLDRLHSRAIVISNGQTSAALVTIDAGATQDNLWRNVTERAEKELGIPARNIFITATHTHTSGSAGVSYQEKVFQSIKRAKDNLQPARMGFGTGVSYINVNRAVMDPKKHTWWEGPNYDGVSDKTVAVVKFEALNGDPIAVYYNYAMHAVIMGTAGMISADAPGAASNYIEDSFDNKIVALWSTAAEGDQNPIFFQQTFDVRDFQTKAILKQGGRDYSDAIPPMTNLDRNDPIVMRLERQQKQMILTLGQMLGEEVLHVMRTTDRTDSSASISANQTTVTCPGRQRTDQGPRAGKEGTYKEADPVSIRLSLLKIGDVTLGGVNAEVYSTIGMRFKRESPSARTMMVTLTNGMAGSGYIPNDAAYGQLTFEVLSSRLMPGCAETAIVNGLIGMIHEAK